jgi:small-conductance mechanosensitive channel
MGWVSHLVKSLAEGRLGANLIAVHGLITVTVLISLCLRRVLVNGSRQLERLAKLKWLETAGEEAARRLRSLLFWSTVVVLGLIVVAGAIYQTAGRDIRTDLHSWYQKLTIEELIALAVRLGEIAGILAAGWFAVRLVRRIRLWLELRARERFASPNNEQPLQGWFRLLQFYLVASIRLWALWGICKVAGANVRLDRAFIVLWHVSTLLAIARLLTLSSQVLSGGLIKLGDHYFSVERFQIYWDRIKRLFPFGERCFEAAVYVTAAFGCMHALHFLEELAGLVLDEPLKTPLGPRIVKCIGIFFLTRVAIELVQVLVAGAFGLFSEDPTDNRRGRTLAPLINSITQYVLYFGSALYMLEQLGVNIMPILASVSVVGLAVGLGAQSLVNDVVSGFFILFENQYLVGDYVQIGDANGIVESVDIRVTHVRDGQGKVYIIPNGQIKGVISYSKSYVNAVVDLTVPISSDLESVFRSMAEAGRLLRQAHREVLADTHITGVVDLNTTQMTVRAVTKVRPGSHVHMQNEYRRLLKQVMYDSAPVARSAAAA